MVPRQPTHVCLAKLAASVQTDDQLTSLMDVERYDESTLEVARKDVLAVTDKSIATRFDASLGTVSTMHTQTTSIGQGKLRLPSKLLQRASDWGVVIEYKPNCFLTVLGTTVNWLQLMDRTTGECYREADSKTTCRGDFLAMKFQDKTKGDCCDQASGIDRCERQLSRDWQAYKRLKASCELHVTKIGNNKTFLLLEDFWA